MVKGKGGAPKITINEKTINDMLNLPAYPLTYDIEVYNYLTDKKVINFSYAMFIKIMSQYRHDINGDNKEVKRNRQLTDFETKFCETVELMKEISVSAIKYKAYMGANNDETGRTALAYLDRYDIRNKQMEQDIKKPDVEVHNDNKQINITFKKASE